MKILDKRAEAFFTGAEDVLGFNPCGDITNHDKGAGASIEFGNDSGQLTGADVTRFSTEMEFLSAEFVLFLELSEKLRAFGGIRPEIHLGRRFAKSFFAGVPSETGETLVDVEVRSVGEDVNAERIGAPTKSRSEDVFGTAQGEFSGMEFPGHALLFAVGEDEAEGRAKKRSGDRYPGDEELFFGDAASHENDEEGNADRKDMGEDEISKAGRRFVNWRLSGALPGGRKNNDEETRQGGNEIAPTGGAGVGAKGEEIVAIGKNGGEEDNRHGG